MVTQETYHVTQQATSADEEIDRISPASGESWYIDYIIVSGNGNGPFDRDGYTQIGITSTAVNAQFISDIPNQHAYEPQYEPSSIEHKYVDVDKYIDENDEIIIWSNFNQTLDIVVTISYRKVS